jgi:hypothetical protein
MIALSGALACFAAAIAVHAVMCRVWGGTNIVPRFIFVGGLLGIGLAWALYDSFGWAKPQFWCGVLVYGLCCELYLFLFTLAMGSVSANLLVNLSRHAMTMAEIEELYDSRVMVSLRIDRLVAAGLFEESSAGLKLTQKGEWTVRAFDWLRTFFRHFPIQNDDNL